MMGLAERKGRSVCARCGEESGEISVGLSQRNRCIEALTRAGQHDLPMLYKAVTMFEVGHDSLS
jgi:hypothetical protein